MRVAIGLAEIATGCSTGHDGLVGSGRQVVTGSCEGRDGFNRSAAGSRRPVLSRSNHDGTLCRDAPVNTAYRAVAFTGSVPEFDREQALHGIAGQNLSYLTHGFKLEELGEELEGSSFCTNSPFLWLLPTSSKPLARARAGHGGMRSPNWVRMGANFVANPLGDAVLAASAVQACADFPLTLILSVTRLVTVLAVALG
ncbi:hypothetical protein Taro_028272 [Colocasia esculenta]|uniref:Uncharacterized protein n=1 Tax=Colocasia esculenta TaxID=4460 RepID=A0A843VMN7_COLES|nr:hypothetical protein [Colocasia esculenta]